MTTARPIGLFAGFTGHAIVDGWLVRERGDVVLETRTTEFGSQTYRIHVAGRTVYEGSDILRVIAIVADPAGSLEAVAASDDTDVPEMPLTDWRMASGEAERYASAARAWRDAADLATTEIDRGDSLRHAIWAQAVSARFAQEARRILDTSIYG